MKFCTSCGAEASDDARFCKKCGKQFDEGPQSPLAIKISNLKRYNLRLEPKQLTWERIRNLSSEEASSIFLGQDKLGEEMSALIRDILEMAKIEGDTAASLETHLFVLNSCIGLCQGLREMFADYTGYKELFDMGNQLVGQGTLSAVKFLNDMLSVDSGFKQVCAVQTVSAWRIRKELNGELIRQDARCHNLAVRAADSYCRAFEAKGKRFTDFFLMPSREYVDNEWGFYLAFLDGLTYEDLSAINESSWDSCVRAMDEHYKDGYQRFFTDRRKKLHESMKEADQNYFWKSHPELAAEKNRTDRRIASIRKATQSIKDNRDVLDSQREAIARRIQGLEYQIDGDRKEVKRLKGKVFGKAKAAEQIETIKKASAIKYEELTELREKYAAINDEIKILDDKISGNNAEISQAKKELSDKIRKTK